MKRLSPILLLSWLVIACGFDKEVPPTPTPTPEVQPASRRNTAKLLPKAMTADEKRRALEIIKNQPITVSTYSSFPTGTVRVPAEYDPMEGVLVRVANDSSLDEFFGNMVKAIIQAGVTAYLVYTTTTDKSEIIQYTLTPKGISSTHAQIKWIQSNVDAFWSRDYGPWHVYVNGKRVIIDMKYYPTRPDDDYIPLKLSVLWNEDAYKGPLFTEGGNFMTDGKGTCWTSQGIFDTNNISPNQLSAIYKKYMGCQKTYSPQPIYEEGTTHVDMFSKIINDTTILVGQSQSSYGASSAEIASLEAAAKFYASNTNVNGQAFKVVRIPMRFGNSTDGRVYYAYTNSTILNKSVLVPTYGLTTDAAALKVYSDNMPGYTVIAVADGQSVIPLGGSVHCTTMQIPTATTTTPGLTPPATDNQSGTLTQNQWKMYGPYPAGAGDFNVLMTGTGDADLYVWKNVAGDQLTTSNFACSPYEDGSYEQCTVAGPGTFYVGVYGSAAANAYTLKIEYTK